MDKQGLIEISSPDTNKMSRRKAIGIMMIGLGLMLMVYGLASPLKLNIPNGMPYNMMPIIFATIAIVLHELAHGIGFYLYTGKVEFGVKWRTKFGVVAYATSPKSILPRHKMMVIALAPQVMTVAILGILPMLSYTSWLAYSLLMFVGMNLGGGCGDLYCVWQMIRQKGQIFVEDTETGIAIYRRGEA